MKAINVKGIGILLAVLAVFQVVFGLLITPLAGRYIISAINKTSTAKISVDNINVWPLTLSGTVSNLRVFDPEDVSKKMLDVRRAKFRLSPVALLSKRIVVASIEMRGVDINLEGEPDGSFNISRIAESKEDTPPKKTAFFERVKGQRDLFSRIYNMIKGRDIKRGQEDPVRAKEDAKKIRTDVVDLPEGRRVRFKTLRDEYLARIRKLSIREASIKVTSDGGNIDIEQADLLMGGIAVDPVRGAEFDYLKLSGFLRKREQDAGRFDLSYRSRPTAAGAVTDVSLKAESVDMEAMQFVFNDSLPVEVKKGILDINSSTRINNEQLLSRNKLTLASFEIQPGRSRGAMLGIIPVSSLCEALNQVDPLKLDFDITGTLDDPRFSGFEDTVKEVAKPYLQDLEKKAMGKLTGLIGGKTEAKKDGDASGGDAGAGAERQAVDSIKSLFGK